MGVSHDTLVRVLTTTPSAPINPPHVVGVDDIAFKKGRVYGSILVDLERHQPIDVLPDRQADTLAAWLRDHPTIEVLARDRSGAYARGATDGAPQARQVADRWHLLKNLREALERLLNRLHGELRRLPLRTPDDASTDHMLGACPRLRPLSSTEQVARHAIRDRRLARDEAVQRCIQQGMPYLQIAQHLHMSRNTVRQFAQATVFPERAAARPQRRLLDPYEPYLLQRLAEGCTNASQLWRERVEMGYPGARKHIARWMQHYRTTPTPDRDRARCPRACGSAHRDRPLAAPRTLAWLLVRPVPQELSEETHTEDAHTLAHICHHPQVQQDHTCAQRFQAMVRQRLLEHVDGWLADGMASGIPERTTFAQGLQQEYARIRAALTEPWSTGQVEGQINRLKSIKRSMYGRASFDLLKRRVLYQE